MRKREALALVKREAKQKERERLYDVVCMKIAEGQSVAEICQNADMPSARQFHRDLADDGGGALWQSYTRAREMQADYHADEIIDIADNATNDWMRRAKNRGEDTAAYELNGEHVRRSEIRINARKWKAAHLKPGTYGDRQQVDVNVGVTVVRQAFQAIDVDAEDAETVG